MSATAPERSVVVNAVRGEGDCQWLYYSDQTGRWATVTTRDWWDEPGTRRYVGDEATRTVTEIPGPVFRRGPSFAIELSDGRQIGGEMAPYTAIRLACDWVRKGRDGDDHDD